jgi:alpha-tubulin suppressor-like RCC1 family protein
MLLSIQRRFSPRCISQKTFRTLWTWGNNDFGRCGVENNSSASTSQNISPVELKFLRQNLVQQVVCGAAHTLLLSASGRLFSCGLGVQGQLGSGYKESQSEFHPIDGVEGIVCAAAGFSHSAAVTRKGEILTWGSNKQNQVLSCLFSLIILMLNLMLQLGIFKHDDKDGSAYPLSISALQGSKVIQVECGAYHTIVLTAEKEVFTWGKGAHGRLGHGSEDNEVLPRRVESLRKSNIVSIAAGYDHSAAVSADGRVWMWGHGEWYQLGTGNKKNMLEPTLIEIDASVKQVSCGGSHLFCDVCCFYFHLTSPHSQDFTAQQ